MKKLLKTVRILVLGTALFMITPISGAQLPPAIDSYSRSSASNVGTSPFTDESESFAAASPSLYLAASGMYSTDIASIVSACDGDPKKLFDFVRNYIRFTPYRGFRKGADLTWITKAGNDADQADLLVTLLRAAGYSSAQYEYGVLTIPSAAARSWFGADNDETLDWLCGSAGYYTEPNPSGGTFGVDQIWVSVTISGTTYRMHPAYKAYTSVAGIDLEAASGYSHSQFLASGGGTVDPTNVQGVNDADVTTYLTNRASALINTIRASAPNGSVDQIVGGRTINQAEIANLGDAFPPFSVAGNFTFAEPFSSMLDKLDVIVAVPNGTGGLTGRAGFSGRSTRSIGAQRISVSFSPADSRAQVWLDDVLVSEEPLPVSSLPLTLYLRIDHPYADAAGADRTRTVSIKRSGTYVVIDDLNGYDSPLLHARRKLKLEEYQRQGLAVSSREIRSESLYSLGLDLMGQYEQAVGLQSRISRFEPILHHSLGVIRQEDAFSVDVPVLTSYIPRDGADAKFYNNVRVAAVLGSALEHGVIEKHYPSKSAVSTVEYMRRNNANGGKTYLATAANYSTISADPEFIAGWSSSFRDSTFPSLLAAGHIISIPEDGQQIIDQLTGNGYFHTRQGTTGAIINTSDYAAKGGFPTTTGQVDPSQNPKTTEKTEGPESKKNPETKDPIDLYTGASVSDYDDLILGGGGARGLTLSRSYSSAGRNVPSDVGNGWNHSYRSFLSNYTDTSLFFGRGTPEQAPCAIIGIYALNDVMLTESTSALGWVISAISGGWLIDQTHMNAIDVTAGRKNFTFTRHPNGMDFISAAGITARLVQDAGTGLYRIEERFGAKTFFDVQNRVSSYVDADGKALTYVYASGGSGDGKLQTVSDCYGRTLTFAYFAAGASQGLLQSVTDSTGRVVSYTYTGDGNLQTVTDPENGITQFEYDAAGRLWKIVDELNELVAENLYDEFGRVSQQVAEGDAAQTWQFAFTGLRNVQIDPLGHGKAWIYDEKGRNTGFVDALGNRTVKAYDGQDHLISLTNPKNQITSYQYDGRHNLRFVTNANMHTREMVYDAQDNLDYVLDEAGKKTDVSYDAEHHLTSVTDPLLRTTTYQYYGSGPSDGLVQNIIEHNGDTTSFTYDGNGNPDTITRPDASVMDVTYNARGDLTYSKIITVGDPNIHERTMTHDKRRLLKTVRDALNFGVTYGYDARGRLNSETDRFGNTTSQTLSPWSRTETVTEPNQATSIYRNDGAGRQDRKTNALTQVTQYGFDAADRMETVIDALSQSTQFGYDANGNRSSLTNTRAKTWSWTHTAVNLVDTLTSPANRVWDSEYNTRELLETFKEPSLQTTSYQYYDDGRLRQISDSVGVVDYTYDTKGRLDTVTEGTTVMDRDFDALNRLSKFTDASGNVIEYTYDGAGNLRTLKYPGNKTVTYTYDVADRLDFVTDWANRVTDFQYDAKSRLGTIVFPNGTRRRFTYDDAGRISSIRDETSILQVISQFEFGYDLLNRFQWEVATPEEAPLMTLPAATMTYDDDDRLATWNGQACASDPDGNLTSGPLNGSLTAFAYDVRNRLVSAGGANYVYDAENRRVSQTTGSATTTYVNDPQGSLSRLLIRTSGTTSTYYVYGAGMLLYEEAGTATKTYHFDYRGSTVAITADDQVVTDRILYGPYGEVVARQGTSDMPFLYHGAYGVQTDGNNLRYMRARYYNVETRRFQNADPAGMIDGPNLYAFVAGNPTTQVDPSGLVGSGVVPTGNGWVDGWTGQRGTYTGSDYNPPPKNASNPTGHGYMIDASAAGYVGVGGGGGATFILLDNGVLATYDYISLGVGFGGKGGGLNVGEVYSVYEPSDYSGHFINIAGGAYVGGEISSWPGGSGSAGAGINTIGISGAYQYFWLMDAVQTGMTPDDIRAFIEGLKKKNSK